jgi:hypothetical protein
MIFPFNYGSIERLNAAGTSENRNAVRPDAALARTKVPGVVWIC